MNLVWSIICSSIIFVIFKGFKIRGVETYYGIVVNYLTAASVGLLLFNIPFPLSDLLERPWLFPSMALGALFIVIFNLMARTAQNFGVSVASVATKMSLVIPVVAGILIYDETLGILKVVGIVVALLAVYFASTRAGKLKIDRRTLYLPLLVFLGSGIIDLSIKYLEQTSIPENELPVFSAFTFASAGSIGVLSILLKGPAALIRFRPANLSGGITLGIPNFFSIYFLLLALKTPGLTSAAIFTLNNVAIVMLSTLLGVLLFRERLSAMNWIGVALAVASILMISLS